LCGRLRIERIEDGQTFIDHHGESLFAVNPVL
jgi:hypothetical protein